MGTAGETATEKVEGGDKREPAVVESVTLQNDLAQPASSQARGEPAWLWRGRTPSLDGLRGLAILAVVMSHLTKTHTLFEMRGLWRLGEWGRTGVSLAFAISGFLITLLLLREAKKTGSISIRHFYLRRAFRILPGYLAFLAVIFIFTVLGLSRVNAQTWLAGLTYTINFVYHPSWDLQHIWSLSVEEHFYFIWPVLLCLSGIKRGWLLAIAALLVAPLARLALWIHPVSYFDIYFCTFTRIDSIAFGCLLAYVATSSHLRPLFQFSRSTSMGIGVGICLFLMIHRFFLYDIPGYQSVLSYSLESICCVGIIWICVMHSESFVGKQLNSKLFIFIGTLSYSIYLWQQPFLPRGATPLRLPWPMNVIMIFAFALGSYYLIEKPFLRIKNRLVIKPVR